MPSYPEITPELMDEFESRMDGKLPTPDTARKATLKNKKTGAMEQHERWNESAQIEDVTVETVVSQKGDEHDLYQVKFLVTATKGSGKCVGKNVTLSARINPVALKARNKDDGQFKMSEGTLVRLAQLVRACGVEVKGGLSSAQFAAFYPENGDSPLKGKEVVIEIHQHESEGSPTGWQKEVSNIYPLNKSAASMEV